jgi:hypothetical protein
MRAEVLHGFANKQPKTSTDISVIFLARVDEARQFYLETSAILLAYSRTAPHANAILYEQSLFCSCNPQRNNSVYFVHVIVSIINS